MLYFGGWLPVVASTYYRNEDVMRLFRSIVFRMHFDLASSTCERILPHLQPKRMQCRRVKGGEGLAT